MRVTNYEQKEKVELYENGQIHYVWNEEEKEWQWNYKTAGELGKLIREYNQQEWAQRSWCNQWKRLEEKQQDLIFAAFGKNHLREFYKTDILNLKDPQKLFGAALLFFKKIGWNKTCTRCGGSGHFSYCERFGTTCFKCEGAKLQIITPTKAQIARWLKNYPEGIKYSKAYENHEIRGKGDYLRKIEEKAAAE
jgi:hypothetical protein